MSTPTQSFRRTFLITLALFCVVVGEFYLFYWLHTRLDWHPALMLLVAMMVLFSTMIAAAHAVAPPASEAQIKDEI